MRHPWRRSKELCAVAAAAAAATAVARCGGTLALGAGWSSARTLPLLRRQTGRAALVSVAAARTSAAPPKTREHLQHLRPECFAGLSWSVPEVTFGDNFKGPREVPQGLRYCADFVSSDEEAEVLHALDGEGSAWARHIRRAQQFFGLVYYQTTHAVPALQPVGVASSSAQHGRPLSDLPFWLLPRLRSMGILSGERQVNQVQGNEYLEDSGIGLHVEDPAAGPDFATLSLMAPIQLTLQRAVDGRPQPAKQRE